jgi:phospholipid/cholesterol/gamma-HCH transport system ATP-binding protein
MPVDRDVCSREPVIVVDQLTARLGGMTILDSVNFTVDSGEILCIVGGSGCGKTTLLRHLIGLSRPDSGRVLIGGTDIVRADESTLQRIRRGIGVLFQSDALLGSLTLGENIALPLAGIAGLSPESVAPIVRMKLEMVGLGGYENHYPAELSGGMRKRGGLARAMALDPQVLFFDEPSAGLDPVSTAEIENLIRTIHAALGTTMVIVSHQVDLVLRLANRLIMLDKERRGVIADGSPESLQQGSQDPRVRGFLFRDGAARRGVRG